MVKLELTSIGESLGVVLPREVLQRLQVGEGDSLFALETPTGVELTPYDPEVETQLQVARRVMLEDREVLHKLAE